jgi:hypothetical protein
MKTYAIHWKSNVSGTMGTGTKRFEKDAAERLAKELNENYPEIQHDAIIPVPPADSPTNADQPSPQVINGQSALPPPEGAP